MKIKSSKFLLSAALEKQWPDTEFPEICLAGRSNVGKSSFINTILNRKGLAKISSTPGKTRTLNFYLVNENLFLVDVPGYGYAKVHESISDSFGPMIETYLENRPQLKSTILIVDSRHQPTKDDQAMFQYLASKPRPVIVVATKVDKLKKNDIMKHKKMIKEALGLRQEDYLVMFSSLDKIGVDDVWTVIDNLVENVEVPE